MNETVKRELTLDSREVAKMVEKPHNDLMKSIRIYAEYLIEGTFSLNNFFIESAYKDSIGRTLPCYEITKKGCELIANKLTGKKGVLFTAAYVTRFNEMEKKERQLQPDYMVYKVDKKPKLEYVYTPKTFRGEAVITLQDLSYFSGRSRNTISFYFQHYKSQLIGGTDYYLLRGKELAEFRRENKQFTKTINALALLTKNGFLKLARFCGGIPNEIKCFEENKPKQAKSINCFDVTASADAQRHLQCMVQFAKTILLLADEVNYDIATDYYTNLVGTMEHTAIRMASRCWKLKELCKA